jgi:hypothetical protein
MDNRKKCICVSNYGDIEVGDKFYYVQMNYGDFVIAGINKDKMELIEDCLFNFFFKDLQEFREERIKEILN